MIARPAPNLLSIFYIGSLSNDTVLKPVEPINAVQFQCNLLKLYVATCTVTLRNKVNFDAGSYSAVFGNALGNLSFTFEIKEGTDSTQTTGHSQHNTTAAILGGVISAVVVIVLIVVIVVIVIVRRKGQSENGAAVFVQARGQEANEEQSSENFYNCLQQEDMDSPSVYQTLAKRQYTSKDIVALKGSENVYDSLQKEDVNTPSVYQTLDKRQDTSRSLDRGKTSANVVPVEIDRLERDTARNQRDTTYQNVTCL